MKTEVLSTMLKLPLGNGAVQAGDARGTGGVPAGGQRAAPIARSVETATATTEERREKLAEVMERFAEKLNLGDMAVSRKLRFQYDRSINVSVIEVYDSETEELIRQIPSEEVLERMREGVADGLPLIDTLV